MSKPFLVKRILQVFLIAFSLLSIVYVARGQALQGALEDAALWSAVSTLIFVGSMFHYQKTRKPCAVCVEAPQAPEPPGPTPNPTGSPP